MTNEPDPPVFWQLLNEDGGDMPAEPDPLPDVPLFQQLLDE